MKILFWCEVFPPTWLGGVEIFGLQLIRRLQLAGAEVEVVCDHGPFPLPSVMDHEGIRVSRFSMRAALMSRDLGRIKNLVEGLRDVFRRFQPDLVHLNTIQLGAFLYLRVPERKSCRMVLTLHDPPGEPMNQGAFQRELVREAAFVAAVSVAMMRDFRVAFPECEARQEVILNGLELPAVPVLPLPSGPLRLFSAGRLASEKGFDLVPEALAEMEQPAITWTLAGEGKEESPLREQCHRLGLGKQTEFLGRIPTQDVYRRMDESHIVIMPSRWKEPFGLVALQAAQRGRAVIAARTGGLPEIVTHGKTGWLFEMENSRELAARITSAAADRAILIAMGDRARARAEADFSVSAMSARYFEAFSELMVA